MTQPNMNRGPSEFADYKVTVLAPVTRAAVLAAQPYLAFAGRLGRKPSRSLGSALIDQTNSIDPATGETIPLIRHSEVVSLGAKMPGVPGDIHSSRSGRYQ